MTHVFPAARVHRPAEQGEEVRRYSAEHAPVEAAFDLWNGLKQRNIWWNFALHDIRQRFRRSILGPFWITITMGVMVAALGAVFGTLFGQDMRSFLPYLAVGMIFWGLLTSVVSEGSNVFISSERYLRSVPAPVSTHFYRMVARNVIIWAHNIVIYLFVLAFFQLPVSWTHLLVIPGMVLFMINISWMGMATALLSTRFRDIPQVIANVLQVVFYLTPVIWSEHALPGEGRPFFITFNPAYHLLEVVRAPLLGDTPPALSWLVCVAMAVLGCMAAGLLYGRFHSRIAYWA